MGDRKAYKLLAIDLDDTLLRDDNTVSAYTKGVLARAKAKGYEVVIATGRMFQTAQPVGAALGLGDVPMILFSGGVVQRIESREILFEQPISVSVAQQVLRLCKEHGWYVQSYIDDELLIDCECEQSRAYEEVTGAKAVAIGEALYTPSKGPNKLLFIEDRHTIDRIIEIIRASLGDAVELVRSKEHYLEVVAPHVSKGNALQWIGDSWGIDLRDMVSFGNSENDISMLSMTGHSLAVANAESEVKAVSKDCCGSNEEDGVARWIESHLLV